MVVVMMKSNPDRLKVKLSQVKLEKIQHGL